MNYAAKNNSLFQRLFISPLLFVLLILGAFSSRQFAQDSSGISTSQLISELGCSGCHTQLPYKHSLKENIPDLTQAGSRYNEGYLFSYLQSPTAVRKHLGHSRMPDFLLSEQEALALTLYLSTQQKMPEQAFPEGLHQTVPRSLQIRSDAAFADYMNNQALCLSCHGFKEKSSPLAVSLDNMGARLKPDWMRSFLSAPDLFGISAELMPAQFFQPTESQNTRMPLGKNPAQRINRIVDFLISRSEDLRKQQREKLKSAIKKFPEADAAFGKRIFAALNCAGCHSAEISAEENHGPNLLIEGSRVKEAWLKDFLKNPRGIRVSGYKPGSGSRMPGFNFSDEEIQQISAYLMQQTTELPKAKNIANPAPYQKEKAKVLLNDKLPCLGCHQFQGKGGIIGPDLTLVEKRLNPDYLNAVIANPQLFASHSAMPQVPMTVKTREQLASLFYMESRPGIVKLYVPHDKLLSVAIDSSRSAKQYAYYCAPCHGSNGEGNGFNAEYLPVMPTNHADTDYMSTRTDGALYDGIYAGGYILNKHHFMPAWRTIFSDDEIRDLVMFMRKLCNCEEPDWARKKAGSEE